MHYSESGAKLPTVTPNAIYGFFGEYRFLSNFHECPVLFDGIAYTSSEAAYMSCKTDDVYTKNVIARSSPREAKKLGRLVELPEDWDDNRVVHMYNVVLCKFNQNPDLLQKLRQTGTKYLEETNDWGDKFWGCDIMGGGVNTLGKILMGVRSCL